ncbi:MAG: glycosyltransferase [Paludibacteraceae bacterium]|nr:glycosyltransferase [Paludibacteraceae bacterium]
MKLSIITINRNNAAGLRKTLAFVASQTYRNIEHIIIDGASTDGSVDVIREYESANSLNTNSLIVKWISEPDKGIYNAMNKGIKRASGDYIQILNSGDILAAPDVVERMIKELENNNYPELLFGNSVDVLKDGRRTFHGPKIKYSFLTLYRGTYPHEASYYRRELFSEDRYGLYDESLRIASDWKWFLIAIGLGNVKPIYVNIDVVIFDTEGISSTNLQLSKEERRHVLEQVLPATILSDYDAYNFEIEQVARLRRHHLYGLMYLIERVLFKFEKWHVIRP